MMFGASALTGCSSDNTNTDPGEDDTGDNTPTGSSTVTTHQTETLTPTLSPTATETPQPASFEIVETDAPDQVEAFEDHEFSVTVRNIGEKTGTFEDELQLSVVGNDRWEDAGKITIGDIPPGETETWTSNSVKYEDAYQLQFRFVEHDVRFSYDVVIPEPNITHGTTEIVEVDFGYETRPTATVPVTNNGDLPTGRLPVTVDWLDSGGTYIASSTSTLLTLDAGETWNARVDPHIDVEDYSEIADAEANIGQVSTATSIDPENIRLVNDEHRASEQQVLVRGSIKNERDQTIDYIAIVAKVYDSNGDIIGSAWTNETDITSSGQFRFELEPTTYGRNGFVDSHQVAISEETL